MLKIKILIFILFGLNASLLATAKNDTFKKFPNNFFVETGSNEGEGILNAKLAKFKNIYSIEISPKYYNVCKQKFFNDKNIKLFLGDSAEILYDVIKDVNSTITFWLDGHFMGGNTPKGKSNSPILEELNQIKKHHIKNHTILIDDICGCGTFWFDNVTIDKIIGKIKEINPKYEISFVDGAKRKNNILVAQIK